MDAAPAGPVAAFDCDAVSAQVHAMQLTLADLMVAYERQLQATQVLLAGASRPPPARTPPAPIPAYVRFSSSSSLLLGQFGPDCALSRPRLSAPSPARSSLRPCVWRERQLAPTVWLAETSRITNAPPRRRRPRAATSRRVGWPRLRSG